MRESGTRGVAARSTCGIIGSSLISRTAMGTDRGASSPSRPVSTLCTLCCVRWMLVACVAKGTRARVAGLAVASAGPGVKPRSKHPCNDVLRVRGQQMRGV